MPDQPVAGWSLELREVLRLENQIRDYEDYKAFSATNN